MKRVFRPCLALSALLAAFALPVHAQNASAMASSISSNNDATNVVHEAVQLKAQLAAVERETLRRLDCQANSMVSTATGCQEVPGLREHVAYMVAHPELQH